MLFEEKKTLHFKNTFKKTFHFECEEPNKCVYDGYSSSFNAFPCAILNLLN